MRQPEALTALKRLLDGANVSVEWRLLGDHGDVIYAGQTTGQLGVVSDSGTDVYVVTSFDQRNRFTFTIAFNVVSIVDRHIVLEEQFDVG